ncbi:Phosphodiesterase yfcE [Leminorella richardii]|uniref:Phosphoesterase n=1 Tax=Leminorella richardii TaxID=158841 RepID=A0A2X4V4P8_9GAMM|nr:phosphodiesterase [Leminorella richardii]SQI41752.1 Phosphodiesterase yfcE [Leminorella richardii]
MKLMFASDLHGSLPATEKVLEQFVRLKADRLILLGDLMYHGPRNPLPEGYAPAEVADRLNSVAERIIAVRGNCDSEVDQMLLTFPIEATWQQVLLEDRRLFLTHGHHYHPQKLPPLGAGDVFVYGHTHIPQAEKWEQLFLFNPGSVSLPKGGHPASFGLLDEGELRVMTLSQGQTLVQVSL